MASGKGLEGSTIIIKRQAASPASGHHGGAWKVAYADFVTAMMAFFLLMWLLNATTEDQRKGLADYFNPTIVQQQPGASGDGVEQGVRHAVTESLPDSMNAAEFEQIAQQIQQQLTGTGAESMQLTNILRHVVTRMTDEGLVIELTDLVDEPLFIGDTAEATPPLTEISRIVAQVLRHTKKRIAISGHVRSFPEMLVTSPVWTLSDSRAHAVRELMEKGGLDQARVQRVTGYADRKHRHANPMHASNNRIEVILLR